MPRVPFDPATDYYQLLGVRPGASAEEIQTAYRRLAKEYHPDLNAGSSTAAARMARVNVAKSVLLDRATRASYAGACRSAVARSTRWRLASSAASLTAAPHVIVVLDPAVMGAGGVRAVSAITISMRSTGTSSASAAICARMVVDPWPTSTLPMCTER